MPFKPHLAELVAPLVVGDLDDLGLDKGLYAILNLHKSSERMNMVQ